MKKLLLLLCFLFLFFASNAQYPVTQFIGADSTLVKSRGGLQGRFAPIPFTDTAQANTSRIRQYPGALIYTSGVDKYWYRNSTMTGWVEFTSSGGSTVNIYNSNGTLSSERTVDGDGNGIQFNSFRWFAVGADSVQFSLNSNVFRVFGLPETQDTSTYKPLVINPITGRVLHSSYWYGGGGGAGTDTISLSNRINQKLNISDTANKWVTAVRRSNDSVFYQKGGSWTFAYKDSTGGSSDGYVDSVRFNSTTNILTVYQNTASDQSVYLPPSYLNFDSSYTPLGGMRNDSTGIIKSVRIRRNNVTVTPTQIGDSAMYWDISVPTTYIDSIRRVGMNVQVYKNGAWENAYTDSVGAGGSGTNNANIGSGYRWLNPGTQELRTFFAGLYATLDSSSNTNGLTVKIDTASMFPAIRATISGGGGAPSGNYGNIPVLRNGALVVPGSDSLDFDAGLYIKGVLSASALPTDGVDADSVVVINSSGAFKKRNVSAFARMNTTSAANQFALFNGNGTLYSSSKFNFSDATYPTMSIIGSDPLIYIGPSGTLTNNPAFGSGAGAAIYGGATYKSVQLVDQSSGGIQMARFYNSSGTIYNNLNGLVISNTTSSPSNYQGSYTIQRTIPYVVAGLNYHGFTDQTDFRVGTSAFNSFGSFVTIGNNRTSQDHYAAFQTVWYKDSTNRLGKIYDFVSAVSEMRAGTIDTAYRFKVFEMTKTGGTVVRQYGIQIDNLTAATTNIGAWIYNNVGIGPTAHTPSERLTVDGNILGTGTIKTADPGSGAGAWKLGIAGSTTGLTMSTTQYIEISIGGTTYWLAVVVPPQP